MADPEPTTYHTLVPFLWPMRTEDDRDLMSPFLSLSVFNLDVGQPQMYLYDRWSAPAMTAINPNAGDTLIWNPALLLWEPTPSETPILKQVKIYDDGTNVLEVKRFYTAAVKTGTGTGTMQPTGAHTRAGSTNLNYRVEIDLAGDWRDATFKWSDSGGGAWNATGVPVATGSVANSKVLAPILLNNAVYILFDTGTTGTFVLADRWDFVAIAANNQLYDLRVDTTNSRVDVGTQLRIASDDGFRLVKDASGWPVIYLEFTDIDHISRFLYRRDIRSLNYTQDNIDVFDVLPSGTLRINRELELGGLVHGGTGTPHTQYLLLAGDTMTGDLVITGNKIIHTGTSDGNDNDFLGIAGGGAGDVNRGSRVVLCGNESGLAGDLYLMAGDVAGGDILMYSGASVLRYQITQDAKMGWFGAAPVVKQTVTGSRGGNAALASFLTALANYGLITNSSTA